MSKQDVFILTSAIVSVLGIVALIVTGMVQYEQDRARFQDSHQEQTK